MNVLIVADEFFTDIRVLHMPHHDPDYGFTSLRKIPGSQLFAAIRVSPGEEAEISARKKRAACEFCSASKLVLTVKTRVVKTRS